MHIKTILTHLTLGSTIALFAGLGQAAGVGDMATGAMMDGMKEQAVEMGSDMVKDKAKGALSIGDGDTKKATEEAAEEATEETTEKESEEGSGEQVAASDEPEAKSATEDAGDEENKGSE